MVLDGLAPARRRLVLGVLALLLAATTVVVVTVVARSLGDDPARVEPVAQDAPGPVLLVPGYGASGAGLATLADALERAGRTVEVLTPADDGTGDLRAQADALGEAARTLADRAGADSVDVVGHSAGGVVARLWVTDGDGGSLARRVVTLGSPHHGTDIADIAVDLTPGSCPEACRQLTTDSELLAGLDDGLPAGDETPPGPVWVTLWTAGDQVVVPATSGRLEGAVAYAVQDVCAGLEVDHADLPRDDAVVAMTLAALDVAVPDGPPPAQEVC